MTAETRFRIFMGCLILQAMTRFSFRIIIPTIWGLSIVRTRIFRCIWERAAIKLSVLPTVTKSMKPFLTECEKMGLRIEILHTSGHADEGTIRMLIQRVNPTVIIPVHTENAEKFREIAPETIIEI